jgi:hypothetical protein
MVATPLPGHRCSRSSLPVDVSQGSPETPAVLSLFCQLSHGILPSVSATTVPQHCLQQRDSMATLWHPPLWRVTTSRRVPGLALGAMMAMRCTLALAITVSSQVSSNLPCRETGQRHRHRVAWTMAPQARSIRPAIQRTGLCKG